MSRNKKRIVASLGILALLHRLDRVAEAHEKAGDIKGSQETDVMRYRLFKAMGDENLFTEIESGDMQSLVEQALALSQEQVVLLEEALTGEPSLEMDVMEEPLPPVAPPVEEVMEEEKEEVPDFLKDGSASKASASKASASKGSGSKASASKGSASKGSGSKGSGSKASGSKGSASKASGSKKEASKASASKASDKKGVWGTKVTKNDYINVVKAIKGHLRAKQAERGSTPTGYTVRRVK